MFERFTQHARQVVVWAQEEARGFRRNYIGTEHILLGLLREVQGLAGRALESHGVTVERVHARMMRVDSGEEPRSGQIPFTPQAKQVLEMAPAAAAVRTARVVVVGRVSWKPPPATRQSRPTRPGHRR